MEQSNNLEIGGGRDMPNKVQSINVKSHGRY